MHFNWWKFILAIFLATDLVVLNYFVFRLLFDPPPVTNNIQKVLTATDTCGSTCQRIIGLRVEQAVNNLPISEKTSAPTITTTKTKSRLISHLPISTGGSTLSNDWVDIPGTEFYFDRADYPGLVEIYFETNIHLFNGNGTAFVRLYDDTHGVGVQGSNAQTNNQSNTAVDSGKVSFYSGKNLIKVQIKSLTADTAIFSSGRLRIVTDN